MSSPKERGSPLNFTSNEARPKFSVTEPSIVKGLDTVANFLGEAIVTTGSIWSSAPGA
jgi:hypothetical protein